MDKGQLEGSQGRSVTASRWSSQGVAAYFLAAIALLAAVWFAMQSSRQAPTWPYAAALLVLHALLTLALRRALAFTALRRDWQFRAAVLISAGIYLSYFGWRLVFLDHTAGWASLSAAILGAFLGGLMATTLEMSLWEDNSPPSERIRNEVYQRHQQVIEAPAPEPALKRVFDVCLAALGLVASAPAWLVCAFFIWIEDPGPLLFVKNSVGKGGINFHQLKLRTMVREAENSTGPVLASEEDERVLAIGRLLRKTALDELPQLINILRGEMSFVGPRPQRTVLVRDYLERLPEYAERHAISPGLAGLAQVAGDYYLTPRQKLRFDRLYIRYRSLGFDLKLIVLAFSIAFWFRWQKDWNGKLPRQWFRISSSTPTPALPRLRGRGN
jgi:lipopolysaccharide/colanic/teichoic acid biosynthesis glycosyltransferase